MLGEQRLGKREGEERTSVHLTPLPGGETDVHL
jgi:hypothetical protein